MNFSRPGRHSDSVDSPREKFCVHRKNKENPRYFNPTTEIQVSDNKDYPGRPWELS